jgi:light-regulated signal transduction histidine kinase (bacteriophytochrome)
MYLDQLNAGAIRMGRLIDDLLTYSQIGRENLNLLPVDLNRLMQQVQKNLLDMIDASGAVIRINDQLPTVTGHWATLEMAFQNLLSNAIKFVLPGVTPVITLSVHTDKRRCTVSINDNGIGIAGKYQDRIFGVFQRLHTREEYPGTGIGLAIVKKAVKLHDAQISLNSAPGQGSTFAIHFTLDRLACDRRVGLSPRPVGLELQDLQPGR